MFVDIVLLTEQRFGIDLQNTIQKQASYCQQSLPISTF